LAEPARGRHAAQLVELTGAEADGLDDVRPTCAHDDDGLGAQDTTRAGDQRAEPVVVRHTSGRDISASRAGAMKPVRIALAISSVFVRAANLALRFCTLEST